MSAKAQEEDLCRASGLYKCLLSKPIYYNNNISDDSLYYTDGILYSKDVPFFADDHGVLLEKPYSLSIITSPAPCNRDGSLDQDIVKEVFKRRIPRILKIAQVNGHSNLILGAWGCGAFANDPEVVAEIFKESLDKFKEFFDHICFAVYDPRPGEPVFKTFKEILLK